MSTNANANEKSGKFVIAVYVENRFGVLTRVTSMFTRRGFNIDALTVGETESPEYSRITITMSGDGYARDQMINQLRKLFGNLFQNHGITTAYNSHSGITFIRSHADCQAVNIITSAAKQSGNTAQYTCSVIY